MDDSYPKLLQEVCHEIASKPDLVIQLHSLIQQLSSKTKPQDTTISGNISSRRGSPTRFSASSTAWKRSKGSDIDVSTTPATTTSSFSSFLASSWAAPSVPHEAQKKGVQIERIGGTRCPGCSDALAGTGDKPLSAEQELHVAKQKICFLQKELTAQHEKRQKEKQGFQIALAELQRAHQLEAAARRFEKVVESTKSSLKPSQDACSLSGAELQRNSNDVYSAGMTPSCSGSMLERSSVHLALSRNHSIPSRRGFSSRHVSPSPADITHHSPNSTSSNLASDRSSLYHSHFPSNRIVSMEIPSSTRQCGSVGFYNNELDGGNTIIRMMERERRNWNNNKEVCHYRQPRGTPSSSSGRPSFSYYGKSVDVFTCHPADHEPSVPRPSTPTNASYRSPLCSTGTSNGEEDGFAATTGKGGREEACVPSSTSTALRAGAAGFTGMGDTRNRTSLSAYRALPDGVSSSGPASSLSPTPTAPTAVSQMETTLQVGKKRRRLTPQSPALTYADKVHAASTRSDTIYATDAERLYPPPLCSSAPSSKPTTTNPSTRGRCVDSAEIRREITSTSTLVDLSQMQRCLTAQFEQSENATISDLAEEKYYKIGTSEERTNRIARRETVKQKGGSDPALKGIGLKHRHFLPTSPPQDGKPLNKCENSVKTLRFSSFDIPPPFSTSGTKSMVLSTAFGSPDAKKNAKEELKENTGQETTQITGEMGPSGMKMGQLISSPIREGNSPREINFNGMKDGERTALFSKQELSVPAKSSTAGGGKSYGSASCSRDRSHGNPPTLSPSPRNPQRGPVQPRRFVFTGLTAEEVKELEDAILFIGDDASVLECEYDAPPPFAVTHVVSRGKPRSVKAMCGLVAGRWLVEPSYILRSLAAGFWLDEVTEGGYHLHALPLMGVHFLLTQPNPVLREKLAQVIKYGEGEVIENNSSSSLRELPTPDTPDSRISSWHYEPDKRGDEDGNVVVIFSGDDLLQFAIQQL